MGLIVFPVFQSPVPEAKSHSSGEFLAAEIAAIDQIAVMSGVTPLTAFADQRPVPENFDGPPWKLDDVLGPCDDWFPSSDGQASLAGLAQLIRERPELASELESPESVAEELDDLARLLGVAADMDVRFRLELR